MHRKSEQKLTAEEIAEEFLDIPKRRKVSILEEIEGEINGYFYQKETDLTILNEIPSVQKCFIEFNTHFYLAYPIEVVINSLKFNILILGKMEQGVTK